MATAVAVTNWRAHPGVAMAELYGDALDVSFEKVARREWSYPVKGLKFWNVRSSNKATIKHSYVAASGVVPRNNDTDYLPRMTPIQGFDNSFTPVRYRLATYVERRLVETEQFDVVDKQMRDLNRAARLSIELYAALPFNTAFAAAPEWICADGMNLCDKLRPYEDTALGTWDNEETASTITQSSVGTMRLNFYKNKDEFGEPAPLIMDEIVIPPDQQNTVITTLETSGPHNSKPGSSLNDMNYLTNYNISYSVWEYLTSTTAWFGRCSKSALYELFWYWGASPNIDIQDASPGSNPDVWGKRIRMVFVTGADRPSSLRGNAGA
jgi:hypothetical protein